jgi:hypothetical protein
MPRLFKEGQIAAYRLQRDPGGTFYRLTRWELLLAVGDWIESRRAWDELCDLLGPTKKDVAGNQILIVSFGSPTTPSYLARPADTLLARAIIERASRVPVPETEHLERIWLHSWPERSVHELIPGETGATRRCGQDFA